MVYKNAEIHNIAEIINNDDGSISWRRVPSSVQASLETESGRNMVFNSTGVEIRFVLKGESAAIKMSSYTDDPNCFNTFHVYRGGIQGGWDDHEIHRFVGSTPQDFVIRKSTNIPNLKEGICLICRLTKYTRIYTECRKLQTC